MRTQGRRQFPSDVVGAGLSGDKAPGAVDGAILVIGRQHFVPRLQFQAAGHDIDPGGGVGHKGQVGRHGTKVISQCLADRVQVLIPIAPQVLLRLLLDSQLPGLIGLEHRPGTGAEGAVIEESDPGVQ